MTITLRIVLMIASLLNCIWTLSSVRKARIKIESSIFWIVFSVVLLVISFVPELVEFGAVLLGVQSASNFIFLVIIFLLILKLFRLSMYLSQLESKVDHLVQCYAIDLHDVGEKNESTEQSKECVKCAERSRS